MQALSLAAGQLTYLRNAPRPKLGQNDALIKILIAGICSTDLEIVKGYANYEGILGHEFVGIVEDATDSDWIGRRVVGSINIGCQACEVCHSDGPEHCLNRTVLGIHSHDGVFADYVTLPIDNLYHVPESVSDEQAVFAEPLAAALRILEQIVVSPSKRLAVIGPGKLGMLVAQVLDFSGADLTVIGRRQSSLEMADSLDMQTGLVEHMADNSFDVIVEATGNEAGLEQALRLVKPRGVLILKSTFSGVSRIDLTKLVVGEVSVIGSRCGPFAPAIRILENANIKVDDMIAASYKFSEGVAAFKHASQPGIRKILLRP